MSQHRIFSEAATLDATRAQARRSAAYMLKRRARDLARRPFDLESLYPGLAAASPELMIAVAEHLLTTEAQTPQRWFGFGGEVKMLNAKAVLLLGLFATPHQQSGRLIEMSSCSRNEDHGNGITQRRDHDEFGLSQSKLAVLDIGYIRCLRQRDRFQKNYGYS